MSDICGGTNAMADGWKAGSATVEITPPVGMELGGYAAREQGAIGVHDPLYAKALVLDDGRTRALILACDLLGVDAEDVRMVREAITARSGIPSGHIMIAASHTHSGPSTLHTIGIGERDEHWIPLLREKLISCAERAARFLEPVTLREGFGTAEIGVNRRGRIPEGDINPQPDPNGPVDREVSAITIHRSGTGEPWIVLFNYGCHPSVLGPGNRLISADYVGVATAFVERALGGNTIAMFTNGGAGNVNPVTKGSFEDAARLGEDLGRAVVTLVRQGGRMLQPELEVHTETVALPFDATPTADVATALVQRYSDEMKRAAPGSTDAKIAAACLTWSKRIKGLATQGTMPSALTIDVQRIRLGALWLVAIPAEVFAETARALKEDAHGRRILISYANGDVGYLPTREEISKGGYEVLESHKYYGNPAHFAPEAEERVRAFSLTV
jgi:neutral ceramidase